MIVLKFYSFDYVTSYSILIRIYLVWICEDRLIVDVKVMGLIFEWIEVKFHLDPDLFNLSLNKLWNIIKYLYCTKVFQNS